MPSPVTAPGVVPQTTKVNAKGGRAAPRLGSAVSHLGSTPGVAEAAPVNIPGLEPWMAGQWG